MRLLYSIILYLLTPLVLLRMAWLGVKSPAYLSGWSRRLGISIPDTGTGPLLWIHAVSVGEVMAAVPLVERLLRDHPRYRILMTTITPTGAAVVRQRFGGEVIHSYLPYDFPHAVGRFVRKLKPVILLVMETEIWPNLFHHCNRNGISILLVNARLSRKSYNGYKKFRAFTREVLAKASKIAAQTTEDESRFIDLGADPAAVTVTGNMKFDLNVSPDSRRQGQSLKHAVFADRQVWIAASTHDGEERLILDAHRSILAKHPSCVLILAPRHPDRCIHVAELCAEFGFNTVRKSSTITCSADTAVFLLDTLGELMVYYGAADVAFVGGSLLPRGGHNVLEPAALEIPVITGKYTENFTDINQLLVENGAEMRVNSADKLAEKICLLLGDPQLRRRMGRAGREIVERNRGSTDRIMQLIGSFIPA